MRTITKDNPITPMTPEICMKGIFKYWEKPKFSQGNPVKRLDFKNSKKTQQDGIKIMLDFL